MHSNPRAAGPPFGRILVQSGSLAGCQIPLPAGPEELILGRLPSCHLAFDPQQDRAVSRRHAALEIRADGVFIRDLGSAAGTLVSGRPISGAVRLRSGDLVQLGAEGPTLTVLLHRAGAALADETAVPGQAGGGLPPTQRLAAEGATVALSPGPAPPKGAARGDVGGHPSAAARTNARPPADRCAVAGGPTSAPSTQRGAAHGPGHLSAPGGGPGLDGAPTLAMERPEEATVVCEAARAPVPPGPWPSGAASGNGAHADAQRHDPRRPPPARSEAGGERERSPAGGDQAPTAAPPPRRPGVPALKLAALILALTAAWLLGWWAGRLSSAAQPPWVEPPRE